MKKISLLFALSALLTQAQTQDNTNNWDNTELDQPWLQPTIVPVDFKQPNLKQSNKHEYFMNAFDKTPVQLIRDNQNPAKLHIRGGADINYVEIYEWENHKDDYPLLEQNFRGTQYKEIPLNKLPDGQYRLRVIYLHSEIETLLEIQTVGPN